VNKQTQMQKPAQKPAPREVPPADAPTVNRRLAKLWFTVRLQMYAYSAGADR
jgi:hypothetical protein